ncbi:MAG TPA: type II toxin-antitoxin system VapC family toxin [Deltaproteobacteria bacterium]|nr:type II toxin-antitoxin system VapC family toxin [Deltaproteobacteria bacterium]
MVLVDTSVWIAHFRDGNEHLEKLLLDVEVMCHPFIICELACGNLKNRREILSLLRSLSMAPVVGFDEFLYFVDRYSLMGTGIGFVDVHLLASAKMAGVPLWTMDKKLRPAAAELGLAYLE